MPGETAEKPAGEILQLRLNPGRDARLLGGHLWAFSNELSAAKKAEAGALARLTTAGGRSLGVGYYNPASLIAWRLLSREEEAIDAAFFVRRLEAARRLREALFPGETSYRLCFGESDGLPGLVIDRFDKIFVVQALAVGMDLRLDLVGSALENIFKPAGVYLKNDHRSRALEGLSAESRVLSGEVPPRVLISEGGLKFWVAVGAGQKTGFYFDQRENRSLLAPFFKDRRVLDLHCYTGAFSLNAARAGAAGVLGIDSSGPAVELARENAAENGFAGAVFEEGDAQAALARAAAAPGGARPDMILLDPPSFVPSKKHLPKALRAYSRLVSQALAVLAPGGRLAFSTCSHHVSRELFLDILRHAQAKAGRRARFLAVRGQGGDHPVLVAMPETEYLHFALLEVI